MPVEKPAPQNQASEVDITCRGRSPQSSSLNWCVGVLIKSIKLASMGGWQKEAIALEDTH